MKTNLYNTEAKIVGDIDLADQVFSVRPNNNLIHQVVVALDANSRLPWAHTKGRGDVRGGGKRPWRQKGTGRARHASIRSPIWKGGGVTFGPTSERNYEQKINQKMKKKVLAMVLSSKLSAKKILVLDALPSEEPKTKQGAKMLKVLSGVLDGYRSNKGKSDSILVVTQSSDDNAQRLMRNIPHVFITHAGMLNVRDLLKTNYVVLLKDSLTNIEKRVIKTA